MHPHDLPYAEIDRMTKEHSRMTVRIAELERENATMRIALGNLIDACDGNYTELVAECRAFLKS